MSNSGYTSAAGNEKVRTLKLLIAAVSGVGLYFILQIIAPHLPSPSVFPPSARSDAPPVFVFIFRVRNLLVSPLMQPIYPAFFVFVTIVRRDRPGAWVNALLAGLVLPYVVFHLFGLI
jgi:hypothetical protein